MRQGLYEIRLEGHLDKHWRHSFEGMSVTALQGGCTSLRGHLADQAALHGLLARIRDLGLVLVSLQRIETAIEDKEQNTR